MKPDEIEGNGKLEEPIVFNCGPGTKLCKCKCPESCWHKFDGPFVEIDGGWSATCSICGMTAMQHDMWVMP